MKNGEEMYCHCRTVWKSTDVISEIKQEDRKRSLYFSKFWMHSIQLGFALVFTVLKILDVSHQFPHIDHRKKKKMLPNSHNFKQAGFS